MDMGEPEDSPEVSAIRDVADDRLFEQYKLAVEMADRISARRGATNAFFVTVNAALLAAAESFDLPLAAILGVVLAGTWWLLLRSYRRLNNAKFTVINGLEAGLPAQPLRDEWEIVNADDAVKETLEQLPRLRRSTRRLGRYKELTVVEQIVPLIFATLYLISFIGEVF
jgi:hypothetical protein